MQHGLPRPTEGRVRESPLPLWFLALFLVLTTPARAADPPPTGDLWLNTTGIPELETGDPELVNALKPIWRKYRLPAIAGGIFNSRGLERVGTVGVRKIGTRVPATTNDLWHLGSETKAMTATLTARLIEQGRLQWGTTVAEVFPEFDCDPKLQAVTLKQLLEHRGGLAANTAWSAIAPSDPVIEQRLRVAEATLASPPPGVPGQDYLYSNLGYVVIGAMIERVTAESWEQVIQKELFDPLGMRNTGFGGTGTPGQLDQPWGHARQGRPVQINGPSIDNPPVLGPAGRVHASISDWARFLADQLGGAQGRDGVLRAGTYSKLFTPPAGGDYALGWLVVEPGWGDGEVLTHAGCNTMNYAVTWLAPHRNFGVLACINQGDDEAAKAADEAASALIALHPK